MKKIANKITSAVLTLVMLLSLCAIPAFAEEAAALPEESDAQYAVDLLSALGIVDANGDLSGKVSRAEFAVLLNGFVGLSEPVSASDVSFKDVLAGSAEEAYIKSTVAMGYMLPVAEGYFYPAWEITASDAARSLLLTLGYGTLAENDQTFSSFAKTLDLYDGVNASDFNRGEMYKMMYNALMAKVMEQTGFGDDIIYEQIKDINGLYKFHEVVRTRGRINGAGGVILGSGSKSDLEDGVIELDGNRFFYSNHDMASIIGRDVYVYWTDVRGGDTENAIHVEVIEGDTLTLKAAEIADYADLTYEWEENDKIKSYTLKSPYVIYNGEEYTGSYDKATMMPQNGDVTVVKGSGSRDVVIIRSFTDVRVKLVINDSDEQIIIGHNGERYNVGLYEEGVDYYDADGLAASLSEIDADNVISVAQSLSGEKTVIYISASSVTGELELKDDESWTIGETAYDVAPALRSDIAAKKAEDPSFNKTYTFYFNCNGEIAFVGEGASALEDGVFYGIAAKMGTGTGFDDSIALRVYSKTMGGFETYAVADKLELNGSRVEKAAVVEAFKKDGRDGTPGADFVPQPVKVGLNADNEINYLFQAASDNDDGLGFFYFMGSTDPATTGTYYQYRNVLSYNKSGGTDFSASPKDTGYKTIGVATRTEFIQVPYFDDGTIDVDTEKAFISTTRPTGNVSYVVYKENEDDLVASFVIRATASGEKQHCETTFNVHAVLSISERYVDGEVVTAIKTNKMTYYLDNENIDLNALKIWETVGAKGDAVAWIDPATGKQGVHKVVPGDLVNIYADSMGYIQAMEIVYDSVDKVMMGKGANDEANGYINSDYMWFSRNGMYNLLLLNVLKVEDGYLSATVADPADYEADPLSYRHFVGAVPPIVCIEKSGTKLTYRNAVNADIIGYHDSAEDYAQVILSHRYAQQNGTSYIIKK